MEIWEIKRILVKKIMQKKGDKMEKELESDSGKSNLLQILQKMLGLSKSKPILYNNIIPTGRTKKADTITQIQLWMNENNVAPILIDEIDEEFFSNKDRGNNLIVNVSNLSTSNFDFMPFKKFR